MATTKANLYLSIMRHAVSASAGTLITAAVLACFLHASSTFAISEESSIASKSAEDSNTQMEKRDWNKNLKMWGKRGWESLHGGWGLKRDPTTWTNPYYYSPPTVDKRAWQNLQGGWGKRYSPDDEYAIQQLASLIEQEEQQPQYSDYGQETEAEPNDDEKRAWRHFNEGWGKRADTWGNFRGSWGKRDPAWTNLKGIWGKRSYGDRIGQ